MFRLLLLAALCLAAPAQASGAERADPRQVIHNAVEGFIRPGYRAFHASTAALDSGVGALCDIPSAEALDWARERFREAVRAWAEIEMIRFGPVTEDNRLERLLFWPDRKGIALRQVQAVLAAREIGMTDPARLRGASVALQGIGALEYVLFGAGSETLAGSTEPFRCAFGKAVAGSIDGVATDLIAAWDDPEGITRRWEESGPENPLYRDQEEAITELLDIFVHGLELIRDVRLGGFLGAEARDDRPKSALLWRSDSTVATLSGNVAGLRALYFASGLGSLTDADEAWIGDQIAFELDNAVDAIRAYDGPVAELLAVPDRRAKLAFLRIVLSSLSEDFGTRLAGALGLTAGFSSLDGD